MKFYYRVLIVLGLSTGFFAGQAQNKADATDLMKEGMELVKAKKYPEALAEFKSVLITDPTNTQANYQAGFALFSAGKNADAVYYLERAIAGSGSPAFTAATYSLLGSVYGNSNQPQKAIEAYKKGINADTSNQRIYYNLGITYFRNRQYNDARLSFTDAIKKDVNDAGSTRMYALAAFHQNRRIAAIMGFCRFLMLEPNTARSAEAFGNLQNILKGGQLKPEPGYKPAEANSQNLLLKKALAQMATRRYASSADLLAGQLAAVFSGESKADYLFSGYFKNLSQTENMPAFTRYIGQSALPANAKWLSDNPEKVKALEIWTAANKPVF